MVNDLADCLNDILKNINQSALHLEVGISMQN